MANFTTTRELQGRLTVETTRRNSLESKLVKAVQEIAKLHVHQDQAQAVIVELMTDLEARARRERALITQLAHQTGERDAATKALAAAEARLAAALPPQPPWYEVEDDWVIQEDQYGRRNFVQTVVEPGIGEIELMAAVPTGYNNPKKTVKIVVDGPPERFGLNLKARPGWEEERGETVGKANVSTARKAAEKKPESQKSPKSPKVAKPEAPVRTESVAKRAREGSGPR